MFLPFLAAVPLNRPMNSHPPSQPYHPPRGSNLLSQFLSCYFHSSSALRERFSRSISPWIRAEALGGTSERDGRTGQRGEREKKKEAGTPREESKRRTARQREKRKERMRKGEAERETDGRGGERKVRGKETRGLEVEEDQEREKKERRRGNEIAK